MTQEFISFFETKKIFDETFGLDPDTKAEIAAWVKDEKLNLSETAQAHVTRFLELVKPGGISKLTTLEQFYSGATAESDDDYTLGFD